MKPIKVKVDFTIGNDEYFIDDTIEPNKLTYEQIVRLNEKGFIESLTRKELAEYRKGTSYIANRKYEKNKEVIE